MPEVGDYTQASREPIVERQELSGRELRLHEETLASTLVS